MIRIFAALTALALLAGPARANGRFPATVNVQNFAADPDFILLPATFGLLLSHDGGASFQWVCEEAIGYGGTYDPDYAVSPAGWIYATTFAGLRVSKDGGCSFSTLSGPFSNKWVGEIDFSADGRLWATTSTGGTTNDVYVSDDGVTFQSAGLSADNTWWLSLRPAPSKAKRLWVSGYVPSQPNVPASSRILRTDDGGVTWKDLPLTDFALQGQSQIFFEAVSPTNPDLVFARVFRATPPLGDALYRSHDGGEHWTKILEMSSTMRAVLLRADGKTLLVGSDNNCAGDDPKVQKGCVMIAQNSAEESSPLFTRAQSQPRMACLGERPDGTLLACGSNWEPDFFGLGQSKDGGKTWAPIMRFADIAGPLSCGDSTVQTTACARIQWPSLCEQLGLCGDPDTMEPPKKDGGCAAGARGFAPFSLIGVVLTALMLRRRR